MAKLRGILTAEKGADVSVVSRLSDTAIRAYLNTWDTEALVQMFPNGIIQITIRRKGEIIFEKTTEPES